MTTSTQGGGNNTHRKHKTSKHNKTHAEEKKKKKKKSAAPPHLNWCLRSLGMCARYPVPFFWLPSRLRKFLRGMDHQPSRGVNSTKFLYYYLNTPTFWERGYPMRKHTQSRGGDPPSCTGQPRLGYLKLLCGPPRPPISLCHQPRRRPPVRLSGLGQQELVGACR